ncbi:acetate--CoA ligase family protein [Nonomuraea sp. C10]|uniref:acetate--CoA ligase family protein n=1 Tax=Nonomuraea sp. C10 TaxID=2600577 RepID=UPI0011CDF941|nr:acetate--CoA ligase family protein [Nonomuraea sp. C10]TXK40093.1 hypothetical protein FR742_11280 [Nonomuraea sp. C10]
MSVTGARETAGSSRLDGAGLVDLMCAPSEVVVVGASADESKLSSRALAFLLRYGYRGGLHVVHPRHESILGVPCVPRTKALPRLERAVAIVNLPAHLVPAAVSDLDEAGAGAAVVIGSGFESPSSRPRRELEEVIRRPGFRMRVIGPNCVGTMSVGSGAHLNFSTVLTRRAPRLGRIGLVTQSGALGNGLLMGLLRRGAGIAHWFSTGNEMDTGAMELTAGLLARDDVDVVGIFLEGLTDIDWFDRVSAAAHACGKRLFVYKAARTAAGRAAAGGHTGRLVGPNDATTAVLAEAGFTEVDDLATLADCLVVSAACGTGHRDAAVGIVTVSGASGVIGADRVHEAPGLRLAEPGQDQQAVRLDPRLESANPLDIPFLNETGVFTSAIGAYRASGIFDVTVAVTSGLAHDPATLVSDLVAQDRGPSAPVAPLVLCHLSEDDRLGEEETARLAAAGVAVVPTVERAVAALALTSAPRTRAPDGGSGAHVPSRGGGLGLDEARAVLPGLPWVDWAPAPTAEAARRFGFPAVVKAAGRGIVHRSELGAVAVVTGEDELREAFARVAAACREHDDDVLVQRMAPPGGTEFFVSAMEHPEVGPFALVRPGGLLTELIPGQAIISHRWNAPTRRRRLLDSPVGRLCDGYRGRPVLDVDALLDVVATALDAVAAGRLGFVELNPVFLYESGAATVDVVAGQA